VYHLNKKKKTNNNCKSIQCERIAIGTNRVMSNIAAVIVHTSKMQNKHSSLNIKKKCSGVESNGLLFPIFQDVTTR